VRRFLIRGLATGLLVTQSALIAFAQTATPAPTAEEVAAKEKARKDAANADVVVLETFKVRAGFSGSLAAAAEAKEANQSIVEVIMSEDIGKLPDVSIADSLTRLTGVAAQRTNGRAQNLSIRGLTGDFSTTMLNGREQVSTGMNRGVEFDQYPAELLNQVIVYKTAGANLTSQGIAGSVDLITVSPLSKTGRTIAVNGYYKKTELGLLTPGVKETGESYSIAYIDQLAGGKAGIALGYSHTLTPFEGQQFQAWGYDGHEPVTGAAEMTGTKSYVRSSNLTRDGYMGVFEFKPSENIHSTIDLYYSKFEEKQVLRGMEIPIFPTWSPTALNPGFITTAGHVTQGTYTNVHPIVRNDSFIRNDSLFAFGWNLKIGESSAWPVVFDMGYSRINRKDKNLELWSGVSYNNAGPGDTLTVKLVPGGIPVLTKTLDYSDTSKLFLTDAAGWNGPSAAGGARPGYYKGFTSKDELGQFKLLTKHELTNFFKDVEFGVAYTERFKRDGENPSNFVDLPGSATTAPYPTRIGTTDMSFLGITGGIAAFDPFAVIGAGTTIFEPNNGTDFVARRFSVDEKITRPYVQFNIDHKLGSVPVTGNIGVQLNHVDQSSSGKSANGTTVTPVTAGAKYDDYAPSLNLNFKVAEKAYIRFSVARQIARPRMYDMRASRTWGYNASNATSTNLAQSPWSGNGGNPGLKPWKADSIDLAFDKYFKDNLGYFSLALFQKKLLNYVYEEQSLQDFTGYPVLTGVAPTLRQGYVSTPVNGVGGNIKGLEFTLSLSSELLTHKAVKGLGLIMGGAYTDSSVQPWGPGRGTSPINGLSRKVANITLYYEKGGFSARVSEHYRSDYRAFITNFGVPQPQGDINNGGNGFATTQAEKQVDAQVSYALQSGTAKGLTFYLQAYNLNNSPLITLNNGNPYEVMNYQKYGASYSAGVSYKF
jgi:iron complex outermembrane receptor protein